MKQTQELQLLKDIHRIAISLEKIAKIMTDKQKHECYITANGLIIKNDEDSDEKRRTTTPDEGGKEEGKI